MEALQKNNKEDSGIRLAYRFASPENKQSTGPYFNFRKMLYSSTYKPLLNNMKWEFLGNPVIYKKDTKYRQKIVVFTHNTKYIYQFNLSRQYDYINDRPLYDPFSKEYLNMYWRTDSVMLIDTKSLQRGGEEGFSNYDRGLNIYNQPLKKCSNNPKTGFYRDGYCNTGPEDHGTHTVCTRVTNDFLKFTKTKGNDLSTPSPPNHFPGLRDGDYWCLCANRYRQAYENGHKMKVKKEATHKKTLDYFPEDYLQ